MTYVYYLPITHDACEFVRLHIIMSILYMYMFVLYVMRVKNPPVRLIYDVCIRSVNFARISYVKQICYAICTRV